MKYQKYLLLLLVCFMFNFSFSLQNFMNNNSDQVPLKNPIPSSISSFYYVWKKTWGGSSSEMGEGIAIDSYNNVYITGYSRSFGETNNICLVKFSNSSGEMEWYKLWDDGLDDYGHGITVDHADNIYIVGSNYYPNNNSGNIILIKYDKFGNEIWNRKWGGNYSDSGYDVAVDFFNNVYVIGTTYGFGETPQNDGVLIKFNSFGVLEWNKTWGNHNQEFGQDIEIDPLGNIFIVGWSQKTTLPGDDDIYLAKYNTAGAQLWYKRIGSNVDDHGYGIALDLSGNIYLCGRTYQTDGDHGDTCLIKCDNLGNPLWNKTWGGDEMEIAFGVDVDFLGYIYITGWTESFSQWDGMFLIKYNNTGYFQKEYITSNVYDRGADVLINGLNDIYLVGTTYASYGRDMCLIKFGLTSENNLISGYNFLWLLMILGLSSIIIYLIQVKLLKRLG